MECKKNVNYIRMLITQNKHKAQSKGYNSEMKKAKATLIYRDTL